MNEAQSLGFPRFAIARTAFALLATIALAVGVAITAAAPASGTDPNPPNILFIVTDDQRFGTLGPQDASPTDWMPSVKKYFREVKNPDGSVTPTGTAFQNAYVTTPECCPSRASIFTGRYAHNHAVESVINDPANPLNQGASNLAQNTTIQHYLRSLKGYYAGIYGKYMNGWPVDSTNHPKPEEFDDWGIFERGYGAYANCHAPTAPDNCKLKVNETSITDPNGNVSLLPIYSTEYVRQKAVAFLQARRDAELQAGTNKPWFLYLAPFAPHPDKHTSSVQNPPGGDGDSPHPIPAPEYESLSVPPLNQNPVPATNYFEQDRGDKPPYVRGGDPTNGTDRTTGNPAYHAGTCCKRPPMAFKQPNTKNDVEADHTGHLRALKSVDGMVESVMQKVQALGEDNDTLAVFVSDNGGLWGEHGLEGKLTPYTNSIRVHMLMRWPGHAGGGTQAPNLPAVDPRLVANIDLAPTVLEAAGIAQPAPNSDCYTGGEFSRCNVIDGRSLFETTPWRDYLLFEFVNDPYYASTVNTVEAAEPVPSWTSIRTKPSNTAPNYQYTEYGTGATDDPYQGDGNDRGFKEYYNLKTTGPGPDPLQLNNVLANGGSLPAEAQDAPQKLQDARNCAGPQAAPAPGHMGCP